MKIKRPHLMTSVTFLVISFLILTLGGTSNFIAIQKNGGLMPVLSKYSYETDTHFSFQEQEEINEYFFVDRFKISKTIWSIGDFTIILGLVGFLSCIAFLCLDIRDIKKGRLIIKRKNGFRV